MTDPESPIDRRETLNVAYLGPEASFSHQAAIEVFQSPASSTTQPQAIPVSLHPLPSFPAIFQAIQDSSSSSSTPPNTESILYDYALLPIENSTNGSVVQVLDLLAQCGLDSRALYPDLEVCAEYYLPVHHCLFVSPRASSSEATSHSHEDSLRAIRTLYTHPQVWGQCTRFLSQHFSPKHVERIDVGSTSAAAQLINLHPISSTAISTTTDGSGGNGINAAISSKLAGERHKLVCLAENIEDEPGNNTTRFFVVRNKARLSISPKDTASDLSALHLSGTTTAVNDSRHKSLLTFTISHTQPGALADTLAIFKAHGFNLTTIDTRPGRKRNWQYVFFVECEEAMSASPASSPEKETTTSEGDAQRKMHDMLEELGKVTESLRYLGRFVDRLPRDDGD